MKADREREGEFQRTLDQARVGVLIPWGAPNEIGSAVVDAFRNNGCEAIPLYPRQAEWPIGLDLIVIIGPMVSLWPCIQRLNAINAVTRQSVVVWDTEPMPHPFMRRRSIRWLADARHLADRFMHHLGLPQPIRGLGGRLRCAGEISILRREGMLRFVAVFTETHQRFFQRMGIPAYTIPMGYDRRFGEPMGLVRDVDVAFIGSIGRGRRRDIISRLQDTFAEDGIRFVIKDGSPERGHVYREDRARLLNRTKIMLSVMRQPWDDPIFRILFAAPNGSLVISEPVCDPGPFEEGSHFIATPLPNLAGTIRHYLTREHERQRVANCARDYLLHQLTMSSMARRLLQVWVRTEGGEFGFLGDVG